MKANLSEAGTGRWQYRGVSAGECDVCNSKNEQKFAAQDEALNDVSRLLHASRGRR